MEEEKKKAPLWIVLVALIVIIALIVVYLIYPGSKSSIKAYEIAAASYPQMAEYPQDESDEQGYEAWLESSQERIKDVDLSSLNSFFERSCKEFLISDTKENRIYSPLNLYMALALLAQISQKESREQILDLLENKDISTLQQQVKDLWVMGYRDDGIQTSLLANSIWLDEGIEYDQKTLDILAHDYYADSFQGDLGSNEMNQALQAWLNEKTGDLLQKQSEEIELDQNTILALASTLLFKARWQEEFSREKTETGIFHSADGDVEAEFMHQRSDQNYYVSDHFSAICQTLSQGGEIRFILPDETVSPEKLLEEEALQNFLFTDNLSNWPDQDHLFVNKSIVKFDTASTIDLKDGLENLGITDLFEADKADFSALCPDPALPMEINQATHSARVLIDEEGVEAAAFTVISADAAALLPDEREVDFILDRPFLFEIVNDQGLVLFVGVVQNPE